MGGRFERFIIIVLDSVGVGELPDAADYGDCGSNTLANTARAVGGLALPTLARLGLGNIEPVEGVAPASKPQAAYGKMAEVSAGKDTTTGHWEMMGVVLEKPFPTYPDGFPEDVIDRFENAIGRRLLGNKPASGTEIIEELGGLHVETGSPIVYTSADSVFQIAAHEDVIPLEELYRMCLTARRQLTGEHGLGRVIARPFVGERGAFVRTANRRDFSIEPPAATALDRLSDSGLAVAGVGKIGEIFAGRGLTSSMHTPDNMSSLDETMHLMSKAPPGLIFTNLVDFDMLWGHRNDPAGYARGLEAVDVRLPEIVDALRPDDVLVLTADHGCDPTTESTDHSREYVPLIVYGPAVLAGKDLGTRSTFADLGATVVQNFGLAPLSTGESFLEDVSAR